MIRRLELIVRAVRIKEAALMVGFPATGGFLALSTPDVLPACHLASVMLGFFFLSTSVYAFNAWGGHRLDARNDMHSDHPLHQGETTPGAVLAAAMVLFGAALLVFLICAAKLLPWACLLWLLWVAYSHPIILAKGRPVIGSLIHLANGLLMFLMPYAAIRQLDTRGWTLAVFFAMAFVGGHLNHEVMHHDADGKEGLRTSSIVFGRSVTHTASAALFCADYALLGIATAAGLVEPWIGGPFLALACGHLYLHSRTTEAPLTTSVVRGYRDRYRLLFLGAGAMATAAHLAWLLGCLHPAH
ncbi:UbiA prenyltransferase family protein [bacterium]|nr:UbiA prenyltransferase family protein [candidate division CSSED10-310 bacterium]